VLCRHKERGVLDHLPERGHGWVRGKLRRAWANPDADEATRDLEALARQLEKLNPDAAGSLREGLAEMFTVTRLGVTGALLRAVASTNPVESMIEIVRDHARNVQRWKDGDMRLRWAAAGMLAAAGAVPPRPGLRPTAATRRGTGPSNSELQPADPRICQGLTLRCAWRSPPTSTISGPSSVSSNRPARIRPAPGRS
jgi:hypothetical protein